MPAISCLDLSAIPGTLTLTTDAGVAKRLPLSELIASGPESGLSRAEELYSGLCAENPEDEHLWIALFRIYERTGTVMGLDRAVRRLQGAQQVTQTLTP